MSKEPDIPAYVQFLLDSNMAQGIRTDYFIKEPLARAILSVLIEKELVTKKEVMTKFDELINMEIIDLICPEELERNPGLIPLHIDFTKKP